jgi:hypothetical protein
MGVYFARKTGLGGRNRHPLKLQRRASAAWAVAKSDLDGQILQHLPHNPEQIKHRYSNCIELLGRHER